MTINCHAHDWHVKPGRVGSFRLRWHSRKYHRNGESWATPEMQAAQREQDEADQERIALAFMVYVDPGDETLVDALARELMRQRVGEDLWDQYDDADTGPRWLWRDDARRVLAALRAVRDARLAGRAATTDLRQGES